MIGKRPIALTRQNARIRSGAHPIALPMSAWRIFAVISFLLLFALPLEAVPLPIQAQIIPLTSLLALLFLPFVTIRIRVTPLLKVVVLFAVFVLLHSVIALFLDITVLGSGEIRTIAWIRQVIALIMGLSVFLVLRKALINVSDHFIICATIIGALPALAIAFLNAWWGLTGSSIAGLIVQGIRTILIPLGWTGPKRVSGLSLEPSHFAFYLATIVIPVIYVAFVTLKRRMWWFVLLVCTLAMFIWTLSASGWVILLSLLLAGMLFGPKRSLFIIATVCVLAGIVSFIVLFPNNYAFIQIQHLLTGNWTVSIVDRFYGTFGPIMTALSSYSLLGYGLGGTVTHFKEVIPESVQAEIASVKWEEMPSLTNLTGRIFAETGILGLLLFGLMFFVALRELKSTCRSLTMKSRVTFLKVGRLALFAYLVGGTVGGHGSFAIPYLWFWMAVIDSRYMLSLESMKKNENYAS